MPEKVMTQLMSNCKSDAIWVIKRIVYDCGDSIFKTNGTTKSPSNSLLETRLRSDDNTFLCGYVLRIDRQNTIPISPQYMLCKLVSHF